MVIEIKRDFQADVVLNQLYKFTPLQTSFGMNMLAINNGRPMMMNLKDIIQAVVEFREEIIRRRTIFELNKARDRAHVLVGLAIAVENIDPVIELIRNAPNPQEAKDALLRKASVQTGISRNSKAGQISLFFLHTIFRWPTAWSLTSTCRFPHY